MKVALYARVSTEDKGQDPEVQLSILRKMANDRGYEIVGEYVDFASGKDGNRPKFKEMREAARKKKFDAVLAVRLDRVMRSAQHLNALIQELSTYNVTLIFSDMSFDYNNPSSLLVFQVIAAIAQWEREILSARTREGLAHARAKGKSIGRCQRDDIPVQEIANLHAKGLSWGELSKRYGIPASTIRDHVNGMKRNTAEKEGP